MRLWLFADHARIAGGEGEQHAGPLLCAAGQVVRRARPLQSGDDWRLLHRCGRHPCLAARPHGALNPNKPERQQPRDDAAPGLHRLCPPLLPPLMPACSSAPQQSRRALQPVLDCSVLASNGRSPLAAADSCIRMRAFTVLCAGARGRPQLRVARFALEAVRAANATPVDLDDPSKARPSPSTALPAGARSWNLVGTQGPLLNPCCFC